MHPVLEGFGAIFSDDTNSIIWEAVPYLACCVDESPVSGNRSGQMYCKSMTWH